MASLMSEIRCGCRSCCGECRLRAVPLFARGRVIAGAGCRRRRHVRSSLRKPGFALLVQALQTRVLGSLPNCALAERFIPRRERAPAVAKARQRHAKEVMRHFARRTSEDSFRDRLLGSYLVYADTTLRKRMGWR